MGDTEKYFKTVEGTFERLNPPKQLLLVDDDRNDIELTLRVLKKFNVEVTVYHSSEMAKKHAKHKRFDYVMFDLVMPGLDGLQFMTEVVHYQKKASFLLVTGYPLSQRSEAVRRLGAVQLMKPVTEQVLADLLPRKPLTIHKRNGKK